jgi:hypothetical protein
MLVVLVIIIVAVAQIPQQVWVVLFVLLCVAGVFMLIAYAGRHSGSGDSTVTGELVTRDDPPMQMPREEAVARALAERREIQESNRKVNEALEKRAALTSPSPAHVHAITRDLNPGELAVFIEKWDIIIEHLDRTKPPHLQSRPPLPRDLLERIRRSTSGRP